MSSAADGDLGISRDTTQNPPVRVGLKIKGSGVWEGGGRPQGRSTWPRPHRLVLTLPLYRGHLLDLWHNAHYIWEDDFFSHYDTHDTFSPSWMSVPSLVWPKLLTKIKLTCKVLVQNWEQMSPMKTVFNVVVSLLNKSPKSVWCIWTLENVGCQMQKTMLYMIKERESAFGASSYPFPITSPSHCPIIQLLGSCKLLSIPKGTLLLKSPLFLPPKLTVSA